MEQAIEQAKIRLKKCKASLTLVPSIYVHCPKFPRTYTHTQAEILIHVFCRHSLRTLYYATNFLNQLKKIASHKVDEGKTHGSVMISIPDDIYFDFDAFVFSAKSIFSGEIVDKSRSLHEKAAVLLRRLASKAKKEFVDPLLNNIRDEVVHLNLYGSSIGSIAEISDDSEHLTIRLPTAFQAKEKMQVNLIELFFCIFNNVIDLVMQILGIFLLHIFTKFGKPDRNFTYAFTGVKVQLSDFEIPGMQF